MTTTTTTTTKRAGGEKRGNAADRRRSRANLLRHFGDGTVCQCVYCDRLLAEAPGTDHHIERDRIDAGASYAMRNLLPACRRCNLERSDADALTYAAKVGASERVARAIAHAATYRPNR